MATVFENVRLFDGKNVYQTKTILIKDNIIAGINTDIPSEAKIINATGCTLLPGLIDSHTHTSIASLELAIKFGVTTELEMMGNWTPQQRREISSRTDVADLFTADLAMTVPGGHPYEMWERLPPDAAPAGNLPDLEKPHDGSVVAHSHPGLGENTTASTPAEARGFVAARIAAGADFIKIMLEEGSVLDASRLPQLGQETVEAAVQAAHEHGKIAVAHTLTAKAAAQAVSAGMDGLAHVWLDEPPNEDLINAIARSDTFVCPTICLNASIVGKTTAADFASDPRVGPRLPTEWLDTLRGSINTYPQGQLSDVLETVGALHRAGVDILCGTDANIPIPRLGGGLAHGASMHHELQLLVTAGLSPIEALRAATSVPARRFRLLDRGTVEVGMRADLLLVEGDPTVCVADSLALRGVWKGGVRVEGT